MNYMIYCKRPSAGQFSAMNLQTGQVGVGLVYATLIPDKAKATEYADSLAADNPEFQFQVRVAGKSKIVHRTILMTERLEQANTA